MRWKWINLLYICVSAWGGAPAKDPNLIVKAVLTNEKFCLGQPGYVMVPERQPAGAITLRLNVRLFYQNVSSKPIILPYGPNVSRLIIHRRDGAQLKRSITPGLPALPLLDATAMDTTYPQFLQFQIVKSGQVAAVPINQYAVLRVHDPSAGSNESEFLGQSISIQLELDHDRFPKRQVQELTNKWRHIGQLWAGKTITEPLQLDLPASPEISDCSHEYRID